MTSVNRRDFLRLSAAASGASLAANFPAQVFADDTEESLPDVIQEATIAQLQAAMAATHSHHSPLLLLASATA